MKILFVINTLGHAGAEVALLELLSSLSKTEYGSDMELYVMLGQGELAGELPQSVRLLNTRYRDCSVLSKKGRLAMARTVMRSFFQNGRCLRKLTDIAAGFLDMVGKRRIQPDKLCWRVLSDGTDLSPFAGEYDLAVAYLEGASTYFVADHVKAAKKVAFLHIDYENAGYTRRLDKGCYLAYDRIFAVSDEVKERFLNVYPECSGKVGVFHNIINQDTIRRRAEEPGGFSDGFDGIRLLTVGRLTRQKGYDVAVDAMRRLKSLTEKQVRWYVLGEGSGRAGLEHRIASAGLQQDFVLLGAVENPFPYYKQCDIYVHATRFEGKSIAIQEAQTLGCAILASDSNGNREQIVDGVDGMFCRFSPQDIADGIYTLLEDEGLRQRLGRKAAERTYSYESELGELLGLLNESGEEDDRGNGYGR